MLLKDYCLPQLYAHYGVPYEGETPEPKSNLYASYETRVKELLSEAGLDHEALAVHYAALPAMFSAAQEPSEPDPELSRWVDEFLAGYERSALPFYLITIVIKTLEKRLFSRVQRRAPSLDLGIGDGYASDYIFRPDTLTVGSEPLMWALREASATRRHEHYAAVDMTRIAFDDETFNTVLLVHSIDHVEDRMDVLREVARVTRPGGVVALSDASAFVQELLPLGHVYKLMGFPELARGAFDYLLDIGGERFEFYTQERYERVLDELGFEDVRFEYFMAPKLARICYLQFELQLALSGLGTHDDYLRRPEGARLREFFFESVRRSIVPLMSRDAETCREAGMGLNLFITARKRGESSDPAGEPMERAACPECRETLRDFKCGACGREYPVVEGMPLLIPFYADAWADIRDRIPPPPALWRKAFRRMPVLPGVVRALRRR